MALRRAKRSERTEHGEAPTIPPLLHGTFAAAVVALGLLSTHLPARAALRHPAA